MVKKREYTKYIPYVRFVNDVFSGVTEAKKHLQQFPKENDLKYYKITRSSTNSAK